MRLPNPHPIRGYYELADCSRIYPSGCLCRPVRPGQYFAWLCTGFAPRPGGKPKPVGEVLMDRGGVRYFACPEDAARALGRAAKLLVKG